MMARQSDASRDTANSRPDPATLLEVADLSVEFLTQNGIVPAVAGLSFTLGIGETLAIVGESGSGKSVSMLSLLELLPVTGRRSAGSVIWQDSKLRNADLRHLRGSRVSMIFQEPVSSLSPLVTVGKQLREVLQKHTGRNRSQADRRALELLEMVDIPSPAIRMAQYPHQLSGGIAQRVMIAIALASDPELIIADEPTTALDVTTQAQILTLLDRLKRETGCSIIIISHDLAVVSGLADRIVVMYAGRAVEEGPAHELLKSPQHPYTAGLIAATPHPFEPTKALKPIRGSQPRSPNAILGCSFKPRCDYASERCDESPELTSRDAAQEHRKVACWHAL